MAEKNKKETELKKKKINWCLYGGRLLTDRESVRTANDVRNLIHDTNDSRRTRFGHRKSQTERNVTLSSVSGPFFDSSALIEPHS